MVRVEGLGAEGLRLKVEGGLDTREASEMVGWAQGLRVEGVGVRGEG